jgi:DNA-binding transcriptional ArsR family regulator
MQEQEQITAQLREHVESLRQRLSQYDDLRAKFAQAQRALAAFTGTAPGRKSKQDTVFLHLQTRQDGITIAELADSSGLPNPVVGYALRKLIEEGRARKEGRLTNTVYFPCESGEQQEAAGAATQGITQGITRALVLKALNDLGGHANVKDLADAVHKVVGGDLRVVKGRVYPHLSLLYKAKLAKKTFKNDVLYVTAIKGGK